jgi:hypothetical protein
MGIRPPQLIIAISNSAIYSNKNSNTSLIDLSKQNPELMTPRTSLKPGLNKAVNEKHFILRLLSLLFFTLITFSVFSQKTMEVGIFGGVSYYLGDLNPGMHFKNPKIGYGALARFNIDSRWAVKLNVFRGKVKGSSQSTTFLPERNLSFESPVTDISATAEFNFLKYFTGSRRDFISPYIYTGISAFFYDPVANGYSLRSLGTEGQNIGYEGRNPYSSVSVAIPFGLGVKISLAKNLGMTIFWEMHKTFTDYLDDVSQTYYLNSQDINPDDPAAYLSDPSLDHQPGMERGDPKNKDWYSFAGLTVTYKFTLHGRGKCRDNKKF